MLRLPNVSSATHNVYAYRFVNQDGVIQDGSEDYDEHGAGHTLLQTLRENNVQNAMVLASRWYVCKIGSERFTHYGNAVKRLMIRHTYILFTITHILLIIHLQTPKTRSSLNPLRVLMYYVCHIFLTLLSA